MTPIETVLTVLQDAVDQAEATGRPVNPNSDAFCSFGDAETALAGADEEAALHVLSRIIARSDYQVSTGYVQGRDKDCQRIYEAACRVLTEKGLR